MHGDHFSFPRCPRHISASAGRPGCTGWLWQVLVMWRFWIVLGCYLTVTRVRDPSAVGARLHLSPLRLPPREGRREDAGRGEG